MKYFTKYLPVEGEIKPGDYGFSPNSKCVFFALEETRLIWERPGNVRVKLFLCSRDIVAGDEAIDEETNQKLILEGLAWDGFKRLKRPETWFKVIGEVSHKAVWVREGDEFIREDVKLALNNEAPEFCVSFKCPTCLNFH